MLTWFEKRFVLTTKGAKDLLRGIFFTTLLNIALMLPAMVVFFFLYDYALPIFDILVSPQRGFVYYMSIGLVCMVITWFIAHIMYKVNYSTIYEESAKRRIGVAEKLRKLPLASFVSGEPLLPTGPGRHDEVLLSAVRKVCRQIVPPLFLMIMFNYVDRTNLSYAYLKPSFSERYNLTASAYGESSGFGCC
ncbi:MAG: hypothetical protein AAF410_01305 [Pseudomonadota bacterium]